MYLRNNKGFTLIELLVVIAIIGLLSSVLFVSLNSARAKARDAAIKLEVSQFVNLMALNYSEYGSYCQLQYGWIDLSYTCAAAFSGIYAAKAKEICANIYNNAADTMGISWGYSAGDLRIYFGVWDPDDPSLNCNASYSIVVNLNNGNLYCSGSSGVKGEQPGYWNHEPGCLENP